ncbi:hypothetical protein [Mesorhizobium sp. CA12]|uniref:hypothetical protein n=1 Tax=Mesorhizobium sp. CA12 TaxID=2876644 RepID=UPI001CCF1C9B|nr:hypothetical protein [Mesorhizobium sp. CA12]MBZ9860860.1 hypothetical protein [Mesorhizobium sp. CA12]
MFSFFRKKSPAEIFGNQIAAEYLAEGRRLAEEAMQKQFKLYLMTGMKKGDLGDFAQQGITPRDGKNLLFRFEQQFLWGFFHEYVQTKNFPTNGFARISIHLIERFMTKHGFSFEKARIAALEMDAKYNKNDAAFMAIAEHGMAAFHGEAPEDEGTIMRVWLLAYIDT